MSKDYKINRTFELKITTLSPLAINDGEVLSPLSDYYVSEGRVHYVDADKFQQLLGKDKALAKQYESKVEEMKIDSADRFLNDLISTQEKRSSISRSETVPYKGGNTLQLRTIIKSNGNPYIPGSAIKGAIKNAVLYYWLTKSSPKSIEFFVEKNKKLFEEFVSNKEQYEQLKSSKSLSNAEKKEREKELRNLGNKVQKSLNSFLSESEKSAFNILDSKEMLRQPASNLKISDSVPVSFADNVEVSDVHRKTLKSDVKDWVLHTQEYVKPEVNFDVVLQISDSEQDWEKFSSQEGLSKILQDSQKNLNTIFEVLNHFSNAVKDVQREFNLVIPANSHFCNTNESLLFLGSGKGIYKNTILLAIRKYYKEKGRDFKTEFVPLLATIKSDSEDFPNSVSHINNYPLGWVKITDINKDAYHREYDLPDFKRANLEKDSIIQGVLLELNPIPKVQVSIDGEKQYLNANGLSKLKKESGVIPKIGATCSLQITAIKEGEIKDIKIIEV